jgi:acetyltransferase-like isoleucine patch superfamily enzyme
MPVAGNVALGRDVAIKYPDLVNLYGCVIGDETSIGPFVEIQCNSVIGRRCKIGSHSFICEGVVIEDGVMVAHGVMFTNDRYPRATRPDGRLRAMGDWQLERTFVRRGASIGSNVTILCGLTIGAGALVAAGSVVVQDVPEHAVVAGNPARIIGDVRDRLQQEAVA